ncbi:hypothetical protein LWI28_004357 [Acer negundo]|uniref:Uncharacterized protein n=1 Tax=Acer negundo TaxID=4023 RepID=A0AAD5JD76_ACENE|nr:hypothetical protein LWI28_004357 [Acer negundo]
MDRNEHLYSFDLSVSGHVLGAYWLVSADVFALSRTVGSDMTSLEYVPMATIVGLGYSGPSQLGSGWPVSWACERPPCGRQDEVVDMWRLGNATVASFVFRWFASLKHQVLFRRQVRVQIHQGLNLLSFPRARPDNYRDGYNSEEFIRNEIYHMRFAINHVREKKVDKAKLRRITTDFLITESVELRIPKDGGQASNPESDSMAFHLTFLEIGTRLLLQPYIRRVLMEIVIALT